MLVWILKRFFYSPVRTIVARRQKQIDDKIAASELKVEQADSIKHQYENRVLEWEEKKKSAWEELQEQLKDEREKRMQAILQNLEQEKLRLQTLQKRELIEEKQRLQNEAIVLATQFSSRILVDIAGPEAEYKIVQLFIEQIKNLSEQQLDKFQSLEIDEDTMIDISSCYRLNKDQIKNIEGLLNKLANKKLQYTYHQEPELIAGLRISFGPFMMKANLRDELQIFSEIYDE